MKIAVIGDIHGCYHTFVSLHKKLSNEVDKGFIYSVGDLVDRGKGSAEVLQFCIDNNIKPVLGNHERMLLDALLAINSPLPDFSKTELQLMFFQSGGKDTVCSYLKDIPKHEVNIHALPTLFEQLQKLGHWDWLMSLRETILINSILISHAGVPFDYEQNGFDFLWSRKPLAQLPNKFQVIGHTPQKSPVVHLDHFANIDTGCVFGNLLTALVVDSVTMEVLKLISEPLNPLDTQR